MPASSCPSSISRSAPRAASSLLLPRVAGYQRAAELLLLGEPFDAATAREAGFVNRVLPAGELMAAAMEAAQKLAARPAGSLAVTKALMKRPPDRSAIEAIDEEVIYFGDLVAAPAAKEIFAAFLEKRAPDPDKIHGDKK
jgi:enoyl-CoA hydratase/carnithine racemase